VINYARQRATAGPAPFNAPLWRLAIESLDPERRCVVLDLGPAVPQTITLLGSYRCRLLIADLADQLAAIDGAEDAESREAAVQGALGPSGAEPLDLVLCWDLWNYLSLPGLAALMRAVAARCRPGARLHGLVVYTDTQMPVSPGRFLPQPDGQLLWDLPGPETCAAPRYSPEQLGEALADFRHERGMLLVNGLQEFLYRR